MNGSYEKDLDLNLLRVFVVAAEAGSVTAAASRLYLTQPAVSAALRRLADAVGAPLFVRSGRGVALTARGQRLLATARPHLEALVGAALAPAVFDAKTSTRTVRLGLSDANEAWLLAPLLRVLEREAPRMRVIVLPVQFRTIAAALAASSVDLAVTVADELPGDVRRLALFTGNFSCVFDPRFVKAGKKLTRQQYFAHDHVVVSYNGDLRGVVEDMLGEQRSVRVSVPTFHSVGAVLEGSALIATIPTSVARELVAQRPRLRVADKPFSFAGTAMELLWKNSSDDDEALRFVREAVVRVSKAARGRALAGLPAPPKARA